ncbi:IclR family transcriptional regulator [Streptomyces tateyamensis]|uniref:IclR family transcriptional regulator n=1 Tax=Streptomyces tateyamensis TaxID=565073 RepID=A0A2V4P0Q6_9ACTN|nr:IclR family transcriptional regulator [Streptomyces tateyamensis]PYC88217.1 IclR family transcriptional regulator [Streptomyces tateyamensis]
MNTPSDVLGRCAAVLRALSAREPGGATTTQAATDTGLPRPTVHRLLVGLEREGLVERLPGSALWVLGTELYLLGRTASARYDVTDTARPYVQQLARLTGESAFFSARQGDETVCLVREDGAFPIRSHVLYEGIRLPLGVASAGLAILAHLPVRETDLFLSRVELTDEFGPAHAEDQLRARIADARRRGWSLNAGHVVQGSWGMGAAVFDAHDRPQWALSLTGVEQRFTGARQDEYGRLLLEAAHQLTRAIQQRRA